MNSRQAVASWLAGTAIVAIAAVSALASQGIASHWRDRDHKVDGAIDEWPVLDSVGDDLSVAAVNDADDLYLAIATSDLQRRRQLMITGLVVWLDPGGARKQSYGIRIPGAGFAAAAGRGRFGRVGGDPSADGSGDQPPDVVAPSITSIELLGPGKDDRRRLELSAVPQVSVAAGLHEGTLLYELKLPLATRSAEQPYGVGAAPGHPLGFGLETPKVERPQGGFGGRDGRAGGPGGGGRGGGGRRGGFGGGGYGGGRDGGGMRDRGGLAQMKALKIWTTLTLAGAGGR